MKLAEALRIVQSAPPAGAEKLPVFLACGFLPLHLATFLEAHLRLLLPECAIETQTGLYGDLAGNLERLENSETERGVVVFEWADFDSRLGLRSAGGWGPGVLSDIVDETSLRAKQFLQLLDEAAAVKPLAICLPSLPLPPISYQPAAQASRWHLQMADAIADFANHAGAIANVKILSRQRLDAISPVAERLDVKSELSSGFPYRIAHAAKLAELLARLLQPRAIMKGLITDLDDTLWQGLLGEDGPSGISWDLDQHSHIHALYQQMLSALADSGVLIAVASKNDPALALKAFERDDLMLTPERVFPFEVGWNAKSQSVGQILHAWNVSPDSVVFVDDSPLELAEVKTAFPEMNCLQFPRRDDQAGYDLLETLRDLFGRESILEEDTIRLESLRRNSKSRDANSAAGVSSDTFLEHVEAELSLNFVYDPEDRRTLDLINKTNQFNLNGQRLSTTELLRKAQAHNAFFLQVAYRDKYGPLGKIAVMLGSSDGRQLKVDTWVMSCRAFSRRIEHQCLEYLFNKWSAATITFEFQRTDRNGPLQEFLAEILGHYPESPCVLDSATFDSHKPALHHTVRELDYA